MRDEKGSAPLDLTLAGESREAFQPITLFSRLIRYAQAHERALLMSDHIRNHENYKSLMQHKEFKGLPQRLSSCGSYLNFRDYYNVNEIRLHKASWCMNHMLCPLCAIRRGAKYVRAYQEKTEIVLNDNPGLKPYLIGLTVKDGPDLDERFNHLKRAHEAMNRLRQEADRGRRQFIEMNKAKGGVSSYEIKRGKNSNEWHPHLHSTWLCDEKPYETRLSEEWEKITGDSFIVDVKPFREEQDMGTAFLEVFAYQLKFSTMELGDNLEAFKLFHGKRFINSFGLLRGVIVPEDLNDDPLEDEPFVDLFFRYISGSGYNFEPKNLA